MIYVDGLESYEQAPLPGRCWCHMATDGPIEELHEFAARIGLKLTWFQSKSLPHYGLTAYMRKKAVAAGAVEVRGPELARRCWLRERPQMEVTNAR